VSSEGSGTGVPEAVAAAKAITATTMEKIRKFMLMISCAGEK
jgi:hypothetical protein